MKAFPVLATTRFCTTNPAYTWETMQELIAGEPELVLLTRDEFEDAMRLGFEKGRAFQRDRSVEGALDRAGRQLGELAAGMKKPARAQTVVFHPPPGPRPGTSGLTPDQLARVRKALRQRGSRR